MRALNFTPILLVLLALIFSVSLVSASTITYINSVSGSGYSYENFASSETFNGNEIYYIDFPANISYTLSASAIYSGWPDSGVARFRLQNVNTSSIYDIGVRSSSGVTETTIYRDNIPDGYYRVQLYIYSRETSDDVYGISASVSNVVVTDSYVEPEPEPQTITNASLSLNSLAGGYACYDIELTPDFSYGYQNYDYWLDVDGNSTYFASGSSIQNSMWEGVYSSAFCSIEELPVGSHTVTLREEFYPGGGSSGYFRDLCSVTFTVNSQYSGNESGFTDIADTWEGFVNDSWQPQNLTSTVDMGNTTILTPYYETVYGVINGLNLTLSGWIYWLMTPVRVLIQYISNTIVFGSVAITGVSTLIAPAGIILSVLFSCLPDIIIHLGTLVLFIVFFIVVLEESK